MDPNLTSVQAPLSPEAEKAPSSTADTAYAWLSLLFAFLFCQSSPANEMPLGGFLLILALFVTAFVFVYLKKLRLTPISILCAVSGPVVASAMLLTETPFLVNLSMGYALISYCYFLYAAFGNRIEEGFSDYVYMDLVKTFLIFPIASFLSLFPALFNKSARRTSGVLLKILLGLMMAIFPTVLVLLFLSYDDGFIDLMGKILDFEIDDAAKLFSSLFFTLPLAMFGFSLYTSAGKRLMQGQITAEKCKNALGKIRFLPKLTAAVSVLPVLFLYGVFFVSQWKYYVSGFTGVLPANFSYAEYARQGFFELCAVSFINLLLIVSLVIFTKKGHSGSSAVLKVISTVFCLCTLILISTAIAKMAMYIRFYGLTQKRIYAVWFILLIGIVFLLIAVGQYLKKQKTVALCTTVTVVMFAGLALCNVNALCARYNADRYLEGKLTTVDVEAMEELGDSAVPSLVRVATSMDGEKDPELKAQIDELLRRKAREARYQEDSFFSFSVPSALAKNALKDYTAK